MALRPRGLSRNDLRRKELLPGLLDVRHDGQRAPPAGMLDAGDRLPSPSQGLGATAPHEVTSKGATARALELQWVPKGVLQVRGVRPRRHHDVHLLDDLEGVPAGADQRNLLRARLVTQDPGPALRGFDEQPARARRARREIPPPAVTRVRPEDGPARGRCLGRLEAHGNAGEVAVDRDAGERERCQLDLADHEACAEAPQLRTCRRVPRLTPGWASGRQSIPGLRSDLGRARRRASAPGNGPLCVRARQLDIRADAAEGGVAPDVPLLCLKDVREA
mmetsp:Transcript_104177/g.335973  ORF Transcript_104177/g.335973 Transcript_104177/m.335973 type:complete len:277 (-) Transcript_104177:744-1574(-)